MLIFLLDLKSAQRGYRVGNVVGVADEVKDSPSGILSFSYANYFV